jgi:DNA-binding SARP family transcriptional activator
MLGIAAGRNGDMEGALAHGEVALRMQRADGDLWNVAQVLLLVAEAELHLGRVREAGRRIRESIVAGHQMGDLITLSHGAELLARVEARLGNRPQALRLAGAARRCRDRLAGARYPYSLDLEDPDAWLEETRSAVGSGEAARAWADGTAMDPDDIVGIALEGRVGLSEPRGPGESGPAPELRIRALGAPQVLRGDHLLQNEDWGYALPRELLFNLLVRGPRTKEQIGLEFWPDADADQLRGRFRTALYQLRQALGGNDWVTYRDGRYAFRDGGHHWLDVTAFEEAIATARGTVQKDPDSAATELAQAVELYRGDFLEGENPGAWADPVRSRLRRDFLEALVMLGRIRRSQGALDQAAALLRRAVEKDPLGEAAHLELARVLMERGERSEALELLTDYHDRLEEELGAAPGSAVTGLLTELRGGS